MQYFDIKYKTSVGSNEIVKDLISKHDFLIMLNDGFNYCWLDIKLIHKGI